MYKGKLQFRKPDSLMLLATVVIISALMSATAAAAEIFFSKPDLVDLMGGDMTVARVGSHGPAVHMSFISPADVRDGETVNAGAVRQVTAMPEVYLSIRMPW